MDATIETIINGKTYARPYLKPTFKRLLVKHGYLIDEGEAL
jgi:hypothetical protein